MYTGKLNLSNMRQVLVSVLKTIHSAQAVDRVSDNTKLLNYNIKKTLSAIGSVDHMLL